MPSPLTCHLLGGRGAVGAALSASLAANPRLDLRSWSGADGASSYAEFLQAWRGAPDALVVVVGGRSTGTVTQLVEWHVARMARCIDRFDEAGWPGRLLLIGSAAELLEGSRYGAVKAAQHRILATACAAQNVPFLCLRLHSMVPRIRPTRGLFGDLLRQFEAGGTIAVHHLGGARDYVSSEQLALACTALASHPEVWSAPGARVIDIGNGLPITVPDWIRSFQEVFGTTAAIEERVPGHADPIIVADPTPLRELLERCAGNALERYDAARPDLTSMIREWRTHPA